MLTRTLWLAAVLCGFSLLSADRAGAQAPATKPAAAIEEVTTGEYVEFCKAAEAEAANGDVDALAKRFNFDFTFDAALKGLKPSEKMLADLKQGFKSSAPATGMANQFCAAATSGGMWKLLRVQKEKGVTYAWFRLKVTTGLNYHRVEFGRSDQGQLQIADIYVMAVGEKFSDILRRSFLPAIASENRTLIERLAGNESEYIKNFPTIMKYVDAASKGQGQEALKLYRTLPVALQEDKNMLIMSLKAATSTADWKQYEETVATMRRLYPNDANADLLGVDANIFAKQYDEALACVDRVEKVVGGDPHLDDLRAAITLTKGDLPKAKALATKTIALTPPSLDGYNLLVTISVREKDFDETVKLLGAIETRLKLPINDLTKDPIFAPFVASPQYEKWSKGRAK